MITCTYQLGADQISTKIEGNNLIFFDVSSGMVTTIEGLRLSKAGVLKEFPELKENKEWKKIAIKRLKEHMKEFKTEKEKANYVSGELMKHGYDPLFYQVKGWRVKKFVGGKI